MKNKILKYKWIILLIILTIIKLVICSKLPSFYIEGLPYDDSLIMYLTENISNGNWLGEYNDKILTKGMFFPLLLSLFRLIHLPANIGLSLIYILSVITFCYIIRDKFKNKKILYLLYILLLFNPISFASETFERLYRYVIGPAQILFFISFLYGIYKNINIPKKIIPHLIGLGITVTTIILTREDYLFVTALIIICFIIFIIKLKKKSYLLFVFIIVMLIPIITVKTINYHYYGKFILNDLTETSFKDAYIKILSVKPNKYVYRVSVPKESAKKIINASPTLKSLGEPIEVLYEEEKIDGHLIWFLKTTQYMDKKNQTLEEVNKFWGKVSDELEKAFAEGKLEKRITFPNLYMSPPTKENILKAIWTLPKTIKYVLTYDEVMTFDYENLSNQDKTLILDLPDDYSNYSEYYSVVTQKTDDTEHIGTLTNKGVGGICNLITFYYKYLSIIINVLGIISYIILLIKKQFKNLFLSNIIFICFTLIILGITYTDATSFEAVRYYYLAPVYSLLITFSMITINDLIKGVGNGEVRFDNINALFKRRSQYKRKHKKSTKVFK